MASGGESFDGGNADQKMYEDEPATSCKGKCLKGLQDNLFVILILIGVLVGFGLGFLIRHFTDSEIVMEWITLVGNLYIRVLDLVILPLIASNLIIVIASINPKEQGVTSVITLAFIIGMNLLGSAIGTIMSVLIRPGSRVNESVNQTVKVDANLVPTTSDVLADLMMNIFPDNLVGMCIQQTKSYREYVPGGMGTNGTKHYYGTAPSKDLIGILVVSIAFGLAARASGEKGKPFLDFFRSLCDVTLKLVRVFLLVTPVGVCFMIASAVMGVDDIQETFANVGMFVVTVTVGIGVLFIFILLLYFVTTLHNPFKFLPRTLKSWFISFATTSPIVSLPEMFQGCDEFGVREEISRFFCPISTTLKSDGPAVFISCACMFVAQMEMMDVPPSTVLIIWILTSVSVLAIPHVPSASILISMTILSSAGVSTRNTAYLYAIDWLLDRLRAGIHAISTMYGAAIINHSRSSKTKQLPTYSKTDGTTDV